VSQGVEQAIIETRENKDTDDAVLSGHADDDDGVCGDKRVPRVRPQRFMYPPHLGVPGTQVDFDGALWYVARDGETVSMIAEGLKMEARIIVFQNQQIEGLTPRSALQGGTPLYLEDGLSDYEARRAEVEVPTVLKLPSWTTHKPSYVKFEKRVHDPLIIQFNEGVELEMWQQKELAKNHNFDFQKFRQHHRRLLNTGKLVLLETHRKLKAKLAKKEEKEKEKERLQMEATGPTFYRYRLAPRQW
jgi:hypothetical protein